MAARHVVVVGGGASGLAAAISAEQVGARVTVLEASAKVGRSILASGNGRCNFANADLAPVHYNDAPFVASVMGDDPLATILAFFDGLGLWSCADSEGRLFPRSRAASSVLDVLRARLADLDVDIEVETRVCGLERLAGADDPEKSPAWRVQVEKGRPLEANAVIWAAGGGTASVPCRQLGIPRIEETPALCPLATKRGPIKGLDGVRAQCEVSLVADGSTIARKAGEVLFRPYGVSGIVIFDLSRLAQPGDTLNLNFMPTMSLSSLTSKLEDRLILWKKRCSSPEGRLHFLDGALHPLLGRRCMENACGDKGECEIDPATVAQEILEFKLKVKGTADETHGQVTRGGMATSAFDTHTLQCSAVSGFYACGEALDVDGACGGYNLAWAWCSGLVAGESAALGDEESA